MHSVTCSARSPPFSLLSFYYLKIVFFSDERLPLRWCCCCGFFGVRMNARIICCEWNRMLKGKIAHWRKIIGSTCSTCFVFCVFDYVHSSALSRFLLHQQIKTKNNINVTRWSSRREKPTILPFCSCNGEFSKLTFRPKYIYPLIFFLSISHSSGEKKFSGGAQLRISDRHISEWLHFIWIDCIFAVHATVKPNILFI